MEGTKEKPVIASLLFFSSVDQIFTYGKEIFGEQLAIKYENLIFEKIQQLRTDYLLHAEYPYLPTKNKRYRRIILPAHLIVYRITVTQIEVLDIIHQKQIISYIKRLRHIKL